MRSRKELVWIDLEECSDIGPEMEGLGRLVFDADTAEYVSAERDAPLAILVLGQIGEDNAVVGDSVDSV